jgi:hypothetical protein
MTPFRRVALWLATPLLSASLTAQQADHTGGLTPFRDPQTGKRVDILTTALNVDETPLSILPQPLRRGGQGGYVVSYKVKNTGEASVESYIVSAWVVAPDGTLRGWQPSPTAAKLQAGKTRQFEYNVPFDAVSIGDTIVLAISEAAQAGGPWQRDLKELELEARRVVVPTLK